jgi:hypothetical protein
MHRTTIALASAFVLSAALLSAQGTTETKFRGCLLPGASEDTFLLTKAVAKDDKTKTKVSLKVVADNPKVKVGDRVTQEVEITGTVTPSTVEGQPATLKATKVSWKADYCG